MFVKVKQFEYWDLLGIEHVVADVLLGSTGKLPANCL